MATAPAEALGSNAMVPPPVSTGMAEAPVAVLDTVAC
jgi:hypothetical protein